MAALSPMNPCIPIPWASDQPGVDVRSPAIPLAILLTSPLFYFALGDLLHIHLTAWHMGAVYAVCLSWALMAGIRNISSRKFRFHILDVLFTWFVTAVSVSLLLHDSTARFKLCSFVPAMIVGPYLTARIMTPRQVLAFARLTLSIGLGGCLLTVAWLSHQLLVTGEYVLRPRLFGYEHTVLISGLLAGSTLTLVVALVMRPDPNRVSGIQLALGLFLVPFLLFLILYLGARGALIAALVASVAFLCFARPMRRQIRILMTTFFLVSAATVVLLSPTEQRMFLGRLGTDMQIDVSPLNKLKSDKTWDRGAPIHRETYTESALAACGSIRDLAEHGHSASVRKLLYQQAVLMFTRAPLTGVGAGQFGVQLCTNGLIYPHSTVLQAFADLGLLGGLPFLAMVVVSGAGLRIAARNIRQSPAGQAAWFIFVLWFYFLITDQFYGSYFLSMPFYMLSGAATALLRSSPPYLGNGASSV